MRRREFISLLGGAAAAWPLAARAQQGERMRRIGVLTARSRGRSGVSGPGSRAFQQGLAQSGWTLGRNVRHRHPLGHGDAADIRRHAAELVALAPDVILAHGAVTVGPLLQATRTVPIVFPTASDPVGAGFVDSLARPGGNATGFMIFEYGMAGKWLELLKEIAPSVTRAAVLRDPYPRRRHQPVCRHPGRGTVAQGGGNPGQCARRRRDRARHHGLRGLRMAV